MSCISINIQITHSLCNNLMIQIQWKKYKIYSILIVYKSKNS